MARTIEKIEIFNAFQATMLDYFSRYKTEEKENRKKSTVSHRLAMLFVPRVPKDAVLDIDLDGVDILCRRGGKEDFAIFWSSTYLTEKEKERALAYHKEKGPQLTLAFSLLEDKDYLLVYRFEKDYLEYLHIDKKDFSERVLKHCLLSDKQEEQEQLLLDIKTTRKKKKTRKEPESEAPGASEEEA